MKVPNNASAAVMIVRMPITRATSHSDGPISLTSFFWFGSKRILCSDPIGKFQSDDELPVDASVGLQYALPGDCRGQEALVRGQGDRQPVDLAPRASGAGGRLGTDSIHAITPMPVAPSTIRTRRLSTANPIV